MVTLTDVAVRVLREFVMGHTTTQSELMESVSLSGPSVSRAVAQLRALGIIVDGGGLRTETPGRPPVQLELSTHGLVTFALVIRSDETRLHLVDAYGSILETSVIPISGSDEYESALTVYSDEITRLTDLARGSYAVCAGVGISFAGSVDPAIGLVTRPSRFSAWQGRPLAADIAARTGLPCAIDNDANALAKAVLWYSPETVDSSFVVILADFGLGSSFCLEGQIRQERLGIPSGLAHTNMLGLEDEQCHCGRRGCLETFVSIPWIERRAGALGIDLDDHESAFSIVPFESLDKLARAGDRTAQALLTDVGRHLSVAVANTALLLQLHLVVLDGQLITRSPFVKEVLVQELGARLDRNGPDLRWAMVADLLGERNPEALGATAIAMDRLCDTKSLASLTVGDAPEAHAGLLAGGEHGIRQLG